MIARFLSENADPKTFLKQLNDLSQKKGISNTKYEDIKNFQKILQEFPVGTHLEHETEAGIEEFRKTEENFWIQKFAPWGDSKKRSEFDIAEWMAGSGAITRGKYKIV